MDGEVRMESLLQGWLACGARQRQSDVQVVMNAGAYVQPQVACDSELMVWLSGSGWLTSADTPDPRLGDFGLTLARLAVTGTNPIRGYWHCQCCSWLRVLLHAAQVPSRAGNTLWYAVQICLAYPSDQPTPTMIRPCSLLSHTLSITTPRLFHRHQLPP